jgi:LPXTG-motif cell wall-anchored protein
LLPWSWSWFGVLLALGGLWFWMKRRSRRMADVA